KLWSLENFHKSLLRQPFPDWWADILFWSLPLFELLVGLAFAIPKSTQHSPRERTSSRNRNISQIIRPSMFSTYKLEQRSFRVFNPFLLSASLIFVFSLYIGLGLLNLYDKRPCGCASVFSDLSWSSHFIINIFLLLISILGWYLSGHTSSNKKNDGHKNRPQSKLIWTIILFANFTISFHCLFVKRFPMRFALFTVKPVLHWPPFTPVMSA